MIFRLTPIWGLLTLALALSAKADAPPRPAASAAAEAATVPVAAAGPRAGKYASGIWTDFEYLGAKFDVFFTIEEFLSPTSKSESYITADALPASFVGLDSAKTLDDALILIRSTFPAVTIERDAANPRIFHAVDERLVANKSYLLNRRASITYDGSCEDVVFALDDQLGTKQTFDLSKAFRVTDKSGKPVDERIFGRPRTRTSVKAMYDDAIWPRLRFKAHDCPVRSILGNYLPLASWNRILWQAFVQEVPNGLRTDFDLSFPWRQGTYNPPESAPVPTVMRSIR